MLDEFLRAPDCEFITTKVGDSDRVIFGDPKDDIQRIRILLDNGYINAGVWPLHTWEHFAANPLLVDGVILPEGPWNDYRYRLERYLLAALAHNRQTDLYVTDDRFLLEYSSQSFLKVNVVSSEDAIALVGAHLRNRHNYLVRSSPDGSATSSLDRGFFYLFARAAIFDTNTLLGEGSDSAKQNVLATLGLALTHRSTQLLKSRDFALFQLLQPHNNQTTDDALYYFDMFLLVMGGMFDVLAQCVDASLEMETQPAEVSWHRKGWIKKLREHDNVFADNVSPPNPYDLTLRLHAILRNTIHGSQLNSLHLTDNSAPTEGLVIIPQVHKKEVRYLLEASGGAEKWGVVESHDEDMWIRPGTLMECLLRECCKLINGIVVHLRGDRGKDSVQGPKWEFPFDAETTQRVKYLAGLADLER